MTDERMGRAGLIWNDAAGGYIDGRSTNPKTGRPYNADAGGTWNDDSGTTWTPNNTGGWTGTRTGGGGPGGGGWGGGPGGGSPPGGGAPGGKRNLDLLLKRLDELWNSPTPTYDAPQQDEENDDNAADKAFRNRARERAGHRLKSGIDALGETLASRGIAGSSKVAAGQMGQLFMGNTAENAEADRQITEGRAGRNRSIRDANFAARQQALRDNQQAAVSSKNRLASLLQYYGMLGDTMY